MTNRARMTNIQIEQFLDAYQDCALEGIAVNKAGATRRAYQNELELNPEFAANVEAIKDVVYDQAEREAYRRAFEGYEKETWYKGERFATTVYSDKLAEFLLKAYKKEKFADRKEITGANGGKLEINVVNFNESDVEDNIRQKIVNTIATDITDSHTGDPTYTNGDQEQDVPIIITQHIGEEDDDSVDPDRQDDSDNPDLDMF